MTTNVCEFQVTPSADESYVTQSLSDSEQFIIVACGCKLDLCCAGSKPQAAQLNAIVHSGACISQTTQAIKPVKQHRQHQLVYALDLEGMPVDRSAGIYCSRCDQTRSGDVWHCRNKRGEFKKWCSKCIERGNGRRCPEDELEEHFNKLDAKAAADLKPRGSVGLALGGRAPMTPPKAPGGTPKAPGGMPMALGGPPKALGVAPRAQPLMPSAPKAPLAKPALLAAPAAAGGALLAPKVMPAKCLCSADGPLTLARKAGSLQLRWRCSGCVASEELICAPPLPPPLQRQKSNTTVAPTSPAPSTASVPTLVKEEVKQEEHEEGSSGSDRAGLDVNWEEVEAEWKHWQHQGFYEQWAGELNASRRGRGSTGSTRPCSPRARGRADSRSPSPRGRGSAGSKRPCSPRAQGRTGLRSPSPRGRGGTGSVRALKEQIRSMKRAAGEGWKRKRGYIP